jgi:hypothetical protein
MPSQICRSVAAARARRSARFGQGRRRTPYEKIDVRDHRRHQPSTSRAGEVAEEDKFRERSATIASTVINASHVPPLRERARPDIPAADRPLPVGATSAGAVSRAVARGRSSAHPRPQAGRATSASSDNAIQHACLLARGSTINLEDALVSEAAPSLGIRTDLPFKEAKGQLVEMFEREYIEDLMRRHKMNLSAAAREAQIDRKHLRELIRKYGLDPRAKIDGDDAPLPDED